MAFLLYVTQSNGKRHTLQFPDDLDEVTALERWRDNREPFDGEWLQTNSDAIIARESIIEVQYVEDRGDRPPLVEIIS